MIIAQVESTKRYIGCLDTGRELVESLKAICAEKGIDCAHISGYGYLEDPVIQQYSRVEKAYQAPKKAAGLFVSPDVHGSISLGTDDCPDVLLFFSGGAAERGRSKSVTGRVVSATVRQFEFFIDTVDNVLLKRLKCADTGLDLWLQMLPAGFKAGPTQIRGESATVQEEPDQDEEDFGEDDLQIEEGDWLSHPRLGMCYVLTFDGEDRIKVRLGSGRIAELLMSMFKLSLEGVQEGGRVFKVEVRKRR